MANLKPIHIKESHKGLFTEKAQAAHKSVQAYGKYVIDHPDEFSPTTRKQAQFAVNAQGWNHDKAANGTTLPQFDLSGVYNPQAYTQGMPQGAPNILPIQGQPNYAQAYNQYQYGQQGVNSLTQLNAALAPQQNQPPAQSWLSQNQGVITNIGTGIQAASAIGSAGTGGTKVGNTLQALAPALSVIPGAGAIAAPIAGAVGGLINLFGGHKPKYQAPDVKVVRPINNYNLYAQGTNSSSLYKNGGTVPQKDYEDGEYDLSEEEIEELKKRGYNIELL